MLFDDLLAKATAQRQAHMREVGRKAKLAAAIAPPWLRGDLVVAATLHDIGYAHRDSGFHALDGARFLAAEGFGIVVCNLVAHHSASDVEAEVRGVSLGVYDEFETGLDLSIAHQVITWADMTTSPTGQTVTVEKRLEEIQSRYGPDALVTRFIERAKLRLLSAGQSPLGSIRA